jgi:hypothetical protein
MVVSSVRASSVRAMGGATLTISIVGTSISANVDSSGSFTLQNVPTGDLTLSISGTGVDARITITGVTEHEQIHMTITVNGTTAEADETEREHADNRAEVEGQIQSIDLTNRTLVIGRHNIVLSVPAGTPIHHGDTAIDFSKLAVGERIHAHAMKSGTMLVASDVQVQNQHSADNQPGHNDGHDDANEGEVKGVVSGAPSGHGCPGFTFTVGTTTVTATADTRYEDINCGGVVNGVRVEVKGTRTSSTAITAKKIEKD